MSDLYLGVDVGTTSAKCVVVDERGQLLAFGRQGYALRHPHPGWAEQDPAEMWQSLAGAVGAGLNAIEAQGRSAADIRALALSTQADTLIVTDAAGRPLRPALSWMDTRAEPQCRRLLAETGSSFWYRQTGMALSPVSSACKLAWLAEREPAMLAQAAHLCYVPDYLAWRLCGRRVTDLPSASWSPFYSPWERRWLPEVMAIVGVRQEQLPGLAEAGEPLGELTAQAAAELGLAAGTPLVAGAFDQVAAGVGAGARAGEVGVLSCGTAWALYAVADQPAADPAEMIPVCCHALPGQWGLVLPFAGGSAWDWLHSRLQPGLAAGGEGGEPPVFIPHLYGGLAPDWRHDSRGALLGLTIGHGWADIERAVMMGIVCETRRCVEAVERFGGPLPALRMVGGAAQGESWPRLLADTLNRPVTVPERTEAACYGAAVLAAGKAAAGWAESKALELQPDPAAVSLRQTEYERYLALLEKVLST